MISHCVTQVAAYIKRNKHRLKGVYALNSVGDIIRYGKANNFLQMVADEPDLGPHMRGTILVHRGQILNERNEWEDLPHRSRHEDAEEQVFSLPPPFSSLLSTLLDVSSARGAGDSLARVTACVRECIPAATGTPPPCTSGSPVPATKADFSIVHS